MADTVNPLPGQAPARRDRARHYIAVGGSVLLVLGWLGHGWQVAAPGLADRTGNMKGADYIQFYIMGSQIQEGRADALYETAQIAADARRRISPRLEYQPQRNPYGPQLALAFSPLARLSFPGSLVVFSLLSAAAYVAAVWLVWQHAPGLRTDRPYVALVAAACPALLVTLRFGQISTATLLAAALGVAALGSNRRFLAGASLGLLAYKPQLLLVAVPMLLVARDWRTLGGVLVATTAQLAVTWAAAGGDAMRRYVATLLELASSPDLVMLYPENSHSLRGFLRLAGVPSASATMVVVALALACAVPLAHVWRSAVSPLMKMSLLVLLTLLLTPHLLTYDLLLLLVPIAALAERASIDLDHRASVRAVAVAAALYVAPFSPVLAEHTHVQFSTVAIAAAVWVSWRTVRPPAGVLIG
jgi:alpha-1,2-mannosyltransferase